jgi:hypothetical protein
MNKRKRVAWEKHRKAAKKADDKRKAAKAGAPTGGARSTAGTASST